MSRAVNIKSGVCWLQTQLKLWASIEHLEGGCQSGIEQSLSAYTLSVLGWLILCCKADLFAVGYSLADLTSDLQDSRSTFYCKNQNISRCFQLCLQLQSCSQLRATSTKYLWSGFVMLVLILAPSLPSWDPGGWGTESLSVSPSPSVYWKQKITRVGLSFCLARWMWILEKIAWKRVWLARYICCYITGDTLTEKKMGCRSEPWEMPASKIAQNRRRQSRDK